MLRACAYTLVFLTLCARAGQPVRNDAADSAHLPVLAGAHGEPPGNGSQSAARHCGRGQTNATVDGEAQEGQMCCKKLRSSRVVSDGQCSGQAPVRERVCSGPCLPPGQLPGPRDAQDASSSPAFPAWRCVPGNTRLRRVHLDCPDGGHRTYRITVVTTCRCKRSVRRQGVAPALD